LTPRGDRRGTPLTYGGQLRPLLAGIAAVSVLEVAVVEIMAPWAWLRWTLLVVGVYGLIWVLGFTSDERDERGGGAGARPGAGGGA
jgi:hypothetical protein